MHRDNWNEENLPPGCISGRVNITTRGETGTGNNKQGGNNYQ